MNEFIIEKNEYLKENIIGYYHVDYLGMYQPNNPDYINILKNDNNNRSQYELDKAYYTVYEILKNDIKNIYNMLNIQNNFKICVVPRSKANFTEKQLLFKKAVSDVVRYIKDETIDGTDYIIRHTDTYTTHLRYSSYQSLRQKNTGDEPYPGITKATCHISSAIKGNHILLIDDIYTKYVNIDEDAIQTLLDNGAVSVIFYAIAKTIK